MILEKFSSSRTFYVLDQGVTGFPLQINNVVSLEKEIFPQYSFPVCPDLIAK